MKQQTSGLEYALTIQEKYKELTNQLASLNGSVSPEERNRIYNSCLTWITDFNGCQVTELAKLLKEKLGMKSSLFYRDLNGLEKEISKDIQDNSKGKVKAQNGKEPETIDIIVAHPSYEVNNDFVSVGFRETVFIDGKLIDRNFYLISDGNDLMLYKTNNISFGNRTIFFDERNRVLLQADGRWHRAKIMSFLKNPEPPKNLFEEIKSIVKQYVEFPKESVYGLITAWIIATYFHRLFHAFPFLFIYGRKASGKSRTLDLLERLTFNGVKIKGVSVAALADSIDGTRATFLNDQAEILSDPKMVEILGILTDSYSVGGGKRRVIDMSNKQRRIIEFETYCPKAFASTKDIDDDLKDRCVQIVMLKALRDYPYPDAFLPMWGELRDKFYRLLLTKWQEAKEIYETTGEGVTHRVRELWRPLETVLKLEKVPVEEISEIKTFFLESMGETQAELSEYEVELFETLLQMLQEKRQDIFTVAEIIKELHRDESITEKGLQTWVGKMLRQLNLYDCEAGRRGNKRAYSFSYDRVKNIFERYTTNSSGFSGKVVKPQEYQGLTESNIGGNAVATGGEVAVNLPLMPPHATSNHLPEKQVADSKCLGDKEIDRHSNHLATSTTGLGGGSPENSRIFPEETPQPPKYPGERCCKCNGQASRKTYGKDNNGKWGLNFYCGTCEAV